MDNKNFFRALFWALLIFLIWQMLFVPRRPAAETPGPSPEATASAPADSPPGGSVTTQPGGTVTASGPASTWQARGTDREETLLLGTISGYKSSPYRMQMILSNRGAGLDTVDLSDHQLVVEDERRYRLLAPVERDPTGGLAPWRSLVTEKIVVDNVELRLDDLLWTVRQEETSAGMEAHFGATIFSGEEPVLELERVFALPRQAREQKRSDAHTALTVRNVSAQAHEVIVTERGPVGLPHEVRLSAQRKSYCAVRENAVLSLERKPTTETAKKRLLRLYDGAAGRELVWLGAGNQYFTCAVCPVDAEGRENAAAVADVAAVDLDGQEASDGDVTTRLATRRTSVTPGEARVFAAALYLGGKDRRSFEDPDNPDYIRREYIQLITENYGSCTFNFLTDWMIRLLNWLEAHLVFNFGLAIIILVIIVRVLLHPVTKKTQVNMVRMQENMSALQPKLDEMRRKFPNDAHRQQQEMMKAYREAGISPFGQMFGCLPMFLQMPIWVALYSSLNNNIAMRGRGFFWWITDLTEPDYLVRFAHPVNLPLIGELSGFHLLPLLVGILMFAQQKLMPKPKRDEKAAATPQAQQAEQMQKMMPYMSLIMIIFFYKMPSGLNLYIMVSSLIGTLEQTYIRRHLRNHKPVPAAPKPDKPPRGSTWWDRLQKYAADAQRMRSSRERGDAKR